MPKVISDDFISKSPEDRLRASEHRGKALADEENSWNTHLESTVVSVREGKQARLAVFVERLETLKAEDRTVEQRWNDLLGAL